MFLGHPTRNLVFSQLGSHPFEIQAEDEAVGTLTSLDIYSKAIKTPTTSFLSLHHLHLHSIQTPLSNSLSIPNPTRSPFQLSFSIFSWIPYPVEGHKTRQRKLHLRWRWHFRGHEIGIGRGNSGRWRRGRDWKEWG